MRTSHETHSEIVNGTENTTTNAFEHQPQTHTVEDIVLPLKFNTDSSPFGCKLERTTVCNASRSENYQYRYTKIFT